MNQIKEKKSLGGLTFPPLKKSVVKIQTRECLQKMHKSLRITNHIKYVKICSLKQIKLDKYICKKKSLVGGLTFPPLQKSVIKIQTLEWLQKMHKSVRITKYI